VVKIPTNLREVPRNRLIRIVNTMRKAIAAECRRCIGVKSLRGAEDCGGLDLEDGNCPLYPFRPWVQGDVTRKRIGADTKEK